MVSIKHAATTERGWIDLVVQRDRGATQDDYEVNFRLQPDETLAEVFDLYDEIARETEAVVDAVPTSARTCRSRRESRGTPTTSTRGRCGGCCCT